tara:strand:+ start:4428 stop:4742 length:315 start_codon:yes stop_codon:yes gene_type:complete
MNKIIFHESTAKLPKGLYGGADKSCPDLKDSVYLTPTSDEPYDPLPIACFLAQNSRGTPPGDWVMPARYNHKKLLKYIKKKKDFFCTYKFSDYAEEKWFEQWKK